MTTRSATVVQNEDNFDVITWSGLVNTDDGTPVIAAGYEELSAQAIGDATTVVMQGSNDGTNWAALATAVTLTIASSKTPVTRITDRPLYIRPVATGSGTNTKVIVVARRRK